MWHRCESGRGESGSWPLSPELCSPEQCAARCRACDRCRYISYSIANGECSWFRRCDLDALRMQFNGRSYVTLQVSRAEPTIGDEDYM